MKRHFRWTATALLLAGSTAANARELTTADLAEATRLATEYVSTEIGQDIYSKIFGFVTRKSVDGTSAQITIHYRDGSRKKTVEIFCHEHGAKIDCHEE